MKGICAWCGKVLKQGTETTVTHGICELCAAELYARLGLIEEDETPLVPVSPHSEKEDSDSKWTS